MIDMEKLSLCNDNIAILGNAGSGKSFTLKGILNNTIEKGKKTLMLSQEKNEYRDITKYLKGNYFDSSNMTTNLNFDSQLTTVYVDHSRFKVLIDIILSNAARNGIEVVLIDEAFNYLEECAYLLEYTIEHSIQLIVGSQSDISILEKGLNRVYFKKVFKTIVVMQSNMYDGIYQQLLDLYNIKDTKLAIDLIKDKKRWASIIIKDQEIEYETA